MLDLAEAVHAVDCAKDDVKRSVSRAISVVFWKVVDPITQKTITCSTSPYASSLFHVQSRSSKSSDNYAKVGKVWNLVRSPISRFGD